MSTTFKQRRKFRVRVVDSTGQRHIVMAYGFTEGEARINGRKTAERLLKEPVEVAWLKEII